MSSSAFAHRHRDTLPLDVQMPSRFLLRLQSGERAGETFPIPPSGLLIGRRAGNDVRLEESSLSGRHALVRFDGTSVLVEDLGSTNGTRVDGKQVERAALAPGTELTLGSVVFVLEQEGAPAAAAPAPAGDEPEDVLLEGFEDEIQLEAPQIPAVPVSSAAPAKPNEPRVREDDQTKAGEGKPQQVRARGERPAAASARPPATRLAKASDVEGAAADELERIDPTSVTGRGSKRGLLVLAVLLLAGGGAATWLLLPRGERESSRAAAPVEPIAGNRIGSGFSFEAAENDAFIEDESAPRRLTRSRASVASGAFGIGFAPRAGEWARTDSRGFPAQVGQVYRASAVAFAEGDVTARVGLVFSSSTGAAAQELVWSSPAGSEPGELAVAATARTPYDTVAWFAVAGSFVSEPKGGGERAESDEGAEVGSCGFDDAALRTADAGALEVVREGEFELELSAGAAPIARLARLGRPLLTLRVAEAASPYARAASLAVSQDADGVVRMTTRGGGDGLRLHLEARPELFGDEARAVGCLGEGGYREHAGAFEAEGVVSLRLGRGLDQVLVTLPEPARVAGEPRGEGLRVAADVPAGGELLLKLSFTEDRAAATSLAAQARRAERDGDLGLALARWSELYAKHPFEAELVDEAQASLGRIAEVGLVELRDVAREVDHAAFFGLAEIYAECEQRVEQVVARFRSPAGAVPNEVEREARDLQARIDAARDALPQHEGVREDLRRRAIAESLERAGHADLAERLGTESGDAPR